jgi:cell division protein ZapE
MITPFDYYQTKCQEGLIQEDPQQLIALQKLQAIYQNLIHENNKRSSLFSSLRKPQLVQGLYVWGGVGIGKTFLMDCFFYSLPFKNKMRMHFHQFMQRVHNDLTKQQGHQDPLLLIAKQLAKEAIVLCFDEFHVSDITDAMLLGQLLKALFDNGVCLVTTSNIDPDNLYKNGLQRDQFLPAIALIKLNTTVINIATKIDYRLRHLKEAGVFYTPLDEIANQKMEQSFSELTRGSVVDTTLIIIHHRPIKVKKHAGKTIWFDFIEICSVPRSQQDYLAISELFDTVMISNIPVISENERDKICLFINLVDVLYDARVKLIFSAAEPVENIYNKGYMILEYTRTHSRLIEMQSTDYFAGE